MALTPQQESEIYPILDKALDLPPNKGVLHRCTAKRAEYLTRMIQGLRYDSAIESIEMYDSSHPLYGLGSYAYIWVEPHDQGLLTTNLPEPHTNLMWRLIQCLAHHNPIPLPTVTYNRARLRLARAQRKYPHLFNHVYIEEAEPWPIAKYGQPTDESMLIVDIDVHPDSRLAPPTDEQVAIAGFPMKNPPKWK